MGAYLKAKRARTDMGANTHAEGHPDPRESPLNVRQQAALGGRRVGTESGLKATAKGSDRRPDGGGPDDVTFRFEVAGVPEQMKLVLRCDSDDGLWASIVTASAIDADLYPGNSETN